MWFYFFLIKGEGSESVKKSFLSLIYPILYVVLNLILAYNVKYFDGGPAYAYAFIYPGYYSNIFIYIIVIIVLIGIFGGFTFLLTKLKTFIDRKYHKEIN